MRFASGTTRHVYRKALDQLSSFARVTQFKFTPGDFTQFRLWLLNRKHLSVNSVNTYLTACRRFCEFLVELGVLVRNPAWNVHGTAQTFSKMSIPLRDVEMSIASIGRISVLERRDRAFLLVMMECGATISQLIGADIRDLRYVGKKLEIRVNSKGLRGKTEAISLTDQARGALLDYFDLRGRTAPDDPLFTAVHMGKTSNDRLSPRGIRAAMKRYLTFRDGSSLRLDSIRTYCGIRLAIMGKRPEEIRAHMRFKSNMPMKKILENSQNPINSR